LRVLSIELTDFRNIRSAQVEFGPGVNFIFGPNGQGKTNLVEAVAFLSWLKSFRTSRSADLIRCDEGGGGKSALIGAVLEGRSGRHEVRAEIGRGWRKVVLDSAPVCSARETMSLLPVSCLSPDDPAILEGGPEGRRLLLDRFAAMIEPSRTPLFSMYASLVRERNALLRGGCQDAAMLDAVEANMAQVGAECVSARLGAMFRIGARLPAALASMAGTDLGVCVGYSSRWLEDRPVAGGLDSGGEFMSKAASALSCALKSRRSADAQLGFTSVGPHTDDVDVVLQGLRARGHASRGQKKVLMLAWKAAEAAELAAGRGAEPILVLDDALADLDQGRQSGVVEFLLGYRGQSFITSAVAQPGVFCGSNVIPALAGRFGPDAVSGVD